MSAGFGFSVGDFIATAKLVANIVDALRSASHSTSTFQALLTELEALDTALKHVSRLEFDDSQCFEKLALYHAAAQCQRSIDAFWKKVRKYQPHLSTDGTGNRIKDDWMKVKWAVCKSRDVDGFRAEVRGHTDSIQLLMNAIQAQSQRRQYKSLAGMIRDFASQAMAMLQAIASGVSQNVQQTATLLQTCANISQTNLRFLQVVYGILLLTTQMQSQVLREQPVYMLDAYNREVPFHLEFVRSPEALLAVLKANYKDLGCGPDLIDRGEYVIEERGSDREIDLTSSWETCFFPGQRVAMSFILRVQESKLLRSFCPRCLTDNGRITDAEISCGGCGIVYRRRFEELGEPRREWNGKFVEFPMHAKIRIKEAWHFKARRLSIVTDPLSISDLQDIVFRVTQICCICFICRRHLPNER